LTLDTQGMFVGAQQKDGIVLSALHNDCEAVALQNDCEVLKAFIRTVASNPYLYPSRLRRAHGARTSSVCLLGSAFFDRQCNLLLEVTHCCSDLLLDLGF